MHFDWFFQGEQLWLSQEKAEAHVSPAPCGGYVWAVQRHGIWHRHGEPRIFKPKVGWYPTLAEAIGRAESELAMRAAKQIQDAGR